MESKFIPYPNTTSGSLGDFSKEKIVLLVEDNEDVRLHLAEKVIPFIPKCEKLRIEIPESLEQLINLLKNKEFDYAILDHFIENFFLDKPIDSFCINGFVIKNGANIARYIYENFKEKQTKLGMWSIYPDDLELQEEITKLKLYEIKKKNDSTKEYRKNIFSFLDIHEIVISLFLNINIGELKQIPELSTIFLARNLLTLYVPQNNIWIVGKYGFKVYSGYATKRENKQKHDFHFHFRYFPNSFVASEVGISWFETKFYSWNLEDIILNEKVELQTKPWDVIFQISISQALAFCLLSKNMGFVNSENLWSKIRNLSINKIGILEIQRTIFRILKDENTFSSYFTLFEIHKLPVIRNILTGFVEKVEKENNIAWVLLEGNIFNEKFNERIPFRNDLLMEANILEKQFFEYTIYEEYSEVSNNWEIKTQFILLERPISYEDIITDERLSEFKNVTKENHLDF
jgi:hypothetical protein